MTHPSRTHTTVTWSVASCVCRGLITSLIATLLIVAAVIPAAARSRRVRLSSDLAAHLASHATADVDVIVTGSSELVERLATRHGLRIKRFLASGAVLSASREALESLSQDGEIAAVSGNAVVRSQMALTTAVTGAQAAWEGAIAALGPVTGSGIGVAIIDSGIANHPALANRVVANVDFTDPNGKGDDFFGHGTHIAGIVAARDYSNQVAGADSGMAPAAHLINLKVLGSDGSGEVATVVEAIDWAIRYRKEFGIRVVNLSLGAPPTQSYKDDPLCLAVERAVKAGLVVVASAGNYGQTADGKLVYGSVTSPGISPYAITVGALRTQGTLDPSDDEVAPWSSKGPTLVDHIVKPDLVAPGSKIVSAAVQGSVLANTLADRLIDGPGARDYMAMSGTSMAAAVVSGAVALILEGDETLVPLQVKLALQGSADFISNSGLLGAGAGRLDLGDLDELETIRIETQGALTGFSFSMPGGDESAPNAVT
ncbi:MAG TPA: S8 family peptidase, partial [Vicinamibacterales bacterium]|nr:S8 family peptidase [Vicinamibacterales bacterium]